jgi:hypothetical protein
MTTLYRHKVSGKRSGPPPKRGPNPQVPPVKLNKGSKQVVKAGYHRGV